MDVIFYLKDDQFPCFRPSGNGQVDLPADMTIRILRGNDGVAKGA